ncbi:MAG: anaerobic ribonucleoside-triphosphate reductase activating protein [Syntrophales bacterium]|jgi:pyruvate formate lyase activating enzyme
MKIGGLQKVSLIEYPGKIGAIAFTQGCNFRCPYCYNPELVDPDLYRECLPEEGVLSFLERRKGKLDALTITGGEPTMHHDLIDFIKCVRKIGYLIKLDTNGSCPEVLEQLISGRLVDYVAMDIKGPLRKYKTVTRSKIDEDKIRQSIEVIMKSGMPYEFRTTVPKKLLHEDDLLEMGKLLRNASCYILQQFIPTRTLDKQFLKYEAYSQDEMECFREKLKKDIPAVRLR